MRYRPAILVLLFSAAFAATARADTFLYTFDTGFLMQNLLSGIPGANVSAVYDVYVRPEVMSNPTNPAGAVQPGLGTYDLKGAISPMPFPDSHNQSSQTVTDQWITDKNGSLLSQIGDSNPFMRFVFNPGDSLLALAVLNQSLATGSYVNSGDPLIAQSVLNGKSTELIPDDALWGVYVDISGVHPGDTVTFLVEAYGLQFNTEAANSLAEKKVNLEGEMLLTATPAPEPATFLLAGAFLTAMFYARHRLARAR